MVYVRVRLGCVGLGGRVVLIGLFLVGLALVGCFGFLWFMLGLGWAVLCWVVLIGLFLVGCLGWLVD